MARSETSRRSGRKPKGAISLAAATERVNAAFLEMLKEHDRELRAIAASLRSREDSGLLLSDIEQEGALYVLARLPAADAASLTERQRQVAHLAAEGLTNKEIARRLQLRPATVTTHLRAVYKRLHVYSRSALILRFYRLLDRS